MKTPIRFTILSLTACSCFMANAITIFTGPVVNPANGHSYYLLGSENWSASEADAQALGGNLVTINDAAENQWVYNTFSAYGGENRLLWTGLNDASSPGTYQWVSGDPAGYRNFAPGEPNNPSFEYYVYMYPTGYESISRPPGMWDNFPDLPNENIYGWYGEAEPIYGVVEVVPEPTGVALLGLAGTLVVVRACRKSSANL